MRSSLRAATRLIPLALVVAACDPAGGDLGFGAEGTGEVAVVLYLDRDGSATLTPADTLYQGAQVSLRPLGGGAAIGTAVSDLQGVALFQNVRYGDYRLTVDPASVGDSLLVAGLLVDSVRVSALVPQVAVSARLAFPEVSIRQARLLPAGRRVFVRGLVLAGVQLFTDQTSHIADTSLAIRLTNVALQGGLGGNAAGDSVVVLGTVALANGQPVLTSARVTRVATRPPPVPKAITSAVAANAQNGALDADLVLLSSVTISDSMTVSPHFRVTASDGTGAITIELDVNLNINTSGFRPGRIMNVRGVLVPGVSGGWILKPRGGADVTFLN
jgi:hypothetical protein